MQDHNVKQLGRMGMYAKCIGGMHAGDSAGSNPRLNLGKNWRNEKFITSICFLCLGHHGGRRGVVLPSNAKRKFISFAQGPTLCFFA